ncbi:LacI family DNA-binding transcriptional regulator [Lichenihabitans sp. Uapishka_5]|uniref:LacI family DNA-binding transcriptional regulator n=1 Tax=Lichenihabitans sp. Uapishka_5 TaxID=3037302 RepID=UPI0029E7E098|nr:LacI family DNA-binding transcriptional regulator [Lichenihabitans sp. Uapishka_5]MDX7953252.1 LacI family DNA-binding transcriptional regulator [Lichenihabitans sp. Uapishka_5]
MKSVEHERPATAGDVAAEAGVSLATVDRVLNGRPGVRAATSKAVQEAVQRLGFKRDAAAASLARRRRYRFGFLVPALTENSFMQAVRREIEAAALRGLDQRIAVTLLDYAAFDPLALTRRLDACAEAGLMGVALVAVDAPEVHDAVARLIARGVAVVTIVSDAPASLRACFVGPDNAAAGRVAASLLGRFVGPRQGHVLTVAGRMTLRDHAERRLGFAQAMARDFPHLTLLPVAEGLDDRAVTKPLVAAALRDVPDLVGVYSMGAGNRGIVAALEAAGRARNVVAVGHELTPFMREALLGGTFDAAINQDAGTEVRRAVQTLKALADGQAAFKPDPIRIEIFLKDNLP